MEDGLRDRIYKPDSMFVHMVERNTWVVRLETLPTKCETSEE